MPHSGKKINQGSLDEPTSPSRSQTWTKHGGPETVEGHRGGPSDIEVSVDDVTITHHIEETISKYTVRGTSAHIGEAPDEAIDEVIVVSHPDVVREWVVDRRVEGRAYHRTDRLVMVDLTD